jgi:hypothetical protein
LNKSLPILIPGLLFKQLTKQERYRCQTTSLFSTFTQILERHFQFLGKNITAVILTFGILLLYFLLEIKTIFKPADFLAAQQTPFS